MLQITYRGPQSYQRVETPFGTEYLFSEETGYKQTPSTWKDLYFILSLDPSFQSRNFVFSDDPESEKTDRRIFVDQTFIDPEILAKQLVNEEKEKQKNIFKDAKDKYIKGIYDKISLGVLDAIPTDLEEKAEQFAQNTLDAYLASKDPVQTTVEEYIEEKSTEETTVNADETPAETVPSKEETTEPTEETVEETTDALEQAEEALEEAAEAVQEATEAVVEEKKKKK